MGGILVGRPRTRQPAGRLAAHGRRLTATVTARYRDGYCDGYRDGYCDDPIVPVASASAAAADSAPA
ncbi:UNVERIFIED_ORG: hypothetical protein J2791_004052 [Burkholderia contaminans]|nr:hypothetical protein [Burkholderia contaminans]